MEIRYNSPTGANHVGNTIIFPNTWTYISVVRADGNMKFYVNGQIDGALMNRIAILIFKN